MEPAKNYHLDPSSYSFEKCMLWGVARAHFGMISTAWEGKAYSTALKHLVLGILEGIPVLGQLFSLAEGSLAKRRWSSIPSKTLVSHSDMLNSLQSLRCERSSHLKNLFKDLSEEALQKDGTSLYASEGSRHILVGQTLDNKYILYFYSEDEQDFSEEDFTKMMPTVLDKLIKNRITLESISCHTLDTKRNWLAYTQANQFQATTRKVSGRERLLSSRSPHENLKIPLEMRPSKPPLTIQRKPWVQEFTDLQLGLSPGQAQIVANTLDIYTHAHEILPGLFLGNLRAYFSVDPSFAEKHELLDKDACPLAFQSAGLTSSQQHEISQKFQDRESSGTAHLGIKHVVSVTQFKPNGSVPKTNWAWFKPNLTGIDRYQIPVDDDALAWDTIQPRLIEIFQKFEEARQKREPILIHCAAGQSRSVIVLIAYFMSWGIPYEEALKAIQAVRSQAGPKSELYKPLQAVAKKLFPNNPTETFAYMQKAWNDPAIPYPGIVVLQRGLADLPQKPQSVQTH